MRSSPVRFLDWDHPRVGGEKFAEDRGGNFVSGSPPRRRGQGQSNLLAQLANGITPAWAGKRYQLPFLCSDTRDHPRVGGEKSCSRPSDTAIRGSPPHGRGKAELSAAIDHVLGITPAYAGKSRPRRFWAHRSQDHPRKAGKRLTRPAMTGTPRDHPRAGGEKSNRSCTPFSM